MEIEIAKLSFCYEKNIKILDNINIKIRDGEFAVILGPSGCGKTTLLRCIAGLENSYSGSVTLSGVEISHVSPPDRKIAMIFQDFSLYQTMTVRENITLALRSLKISVKEVNSKLERITTLLGIENLLDKKVTKLSGGEQQRVSIARSIIREPKLLLLDEPFVSLDAELKKQIRTEYKRHQKNLGLTSIMVTHDQEEALELADQIIIMDNGKIQQAGSVIDVYQHPNNLFVAQFIGNPKINVIKSQDFDLSISGNKNKSYIGIRPEDIEIGVPNSENYISIEGSLIEIKYNYPFTKLIFHTKYGNFVSLSKNNRSFEHSKNYYLCIPKDRLILID